MALPSMWTLGLKPHELIIHILLLGVPASIVSKFYQRGVRAQSDVLCYRCRRVASSPHRWLTVCPVLSQVLFSYHPSAMGVAYLAVMGEGCAPCTPT